MKIRRGFAGLTLFALPLSLGAASAPQDAPRDAAQIAEQAIVDALAGIAADAQLLVIVGNHVAWAGDPASLDGPWLGLVCAPDCVLLPARVVVDAPSEATGDQPVLHFQTDAGDTEATAWLKTDPLHPWLVAGAITRYPATPRTHTPGSFERSIATPAVGGALLIPLAAPAAAGEPTVLYLQLREAGRRQLLPGRLSSCAGDGVPHEEYLHWAGDLDRDGRGDYLLHLGDYAGDMQLLLSGAAAPHALVGLAGRTSDGQGATRCDFGEQ
jgi:hypothetical protein